MAVPLADLKAERLRKLFFFGIRLVDEDGHGLEDEVLDFHIQSAIRQVESHLGIVILPQVGIVEYVDYRQDVWRNFGFLQTRKRPITDVTGLQVTFGTQPAFDVPADWIRLEGKMGQVHLFPALGSLLSVPFFGTTALTPALLKTDNAPQVFKLTYNAGFAAEPGIDEDMADAILTFAALEIFNIMGDIVLGPGIAGMSLGLDGLSQSISTTMSAEHSAYGAHIKLYLSKLFGSRVGDPGLMHALRSKWRMPVLAIL